MLPAGYQRAVSQLHLHQIWLRRFQASARSLPLTRAAQSHERRTRAGSLSNGACYATQPVRIRKHAKRSESSAHLKFTKVYAAATLYSETLRNDLRHAVADRRFDDVVRLYHLLKDKAVLNRHDFRFIAQCLHTCFRKSASMFATLGPQERQEKTAEFAIFAEKLVEDLKGGILSANNIASIHLLGFFKEADRKDPGLDFWRWLEQQDDYAVSVDVYGAAIELLAFAGKPLAELEELYQRAFVRFPGNFAGYHLSPDAIVPDRDQMVNLPGIPMTLLQGIMTGRLLHGDFKNAYLALDTAIRLLPDQTPTRFFVLYMEERPLPEAYTVFATACRAGIVLPSNQFKKLQERLGKSSDQTSLPQHALSIRAQISALYMYSGGGGQLTANMVNELIIAITRFVRLPDIVHLEAVQKQPIILKLMEIIRSVMTIFARYGAHTKSAAFNAIIGNLGGWGLAKQAIEVALADAQALGIELTATTRRSVLIAYGLNGDEKGVADSWEDLVQSRLTSGTPLDLTDWHCLIKAAHTAGCIDLAKGQYASRSESVEKSDHDSIQTGLDSPEQYAIPTWDGKGFDSSHIITQLDKIQADLVVFSERTKNGPRVQDFGDKGLPMTILRPLNASVSEEKIVELYDERTTEKRPPSQVNEQAQSDEQEAGPQDEPEAVSSATTPQDITPIAPARTQTGILFGTIRYENWKTLNWLLEKADSSEHAYLELVDTAIANKEAAPHRHMMLTLEGVENSDSYGLSDAAEMATETQEQASDSDEAVAAWRERILKLRGR